MRLRAIRADAEAKNAKDQTVAAAHAGIAPRARTLETQHREHERLLSEVMDDRRLWDKLTEGSRRLAVQADSELRRHPDQKIRPLESAEPKPPDQPTVEPGWLADLDQQRRMFREELEARQNVMIPNEDPTGKTKAPLGMCGKASETRSWNRRKPRSGPPKACWKQPANATPSQKECNNHLA